MNMKRRSIFAKLLKFVGKGNDVAASRMAYLSSRQARLARARAPHRVSLSSYHEQTMPTITEEDDDEYENPFGDSFGSAGGSGAGSCCASSSTSSDSSSESDHDHHR